VILRTRHLDEVSQRLRQRPVVALLGARQVGKTTLARQIAAKWPGPTTWFDLERPDDIAQLGDPLLALEPLKGLIVLDEVQRRPELFPVLRVLADRKRGAKFLVLGSASPALLRQTSETLAGRITFYELGGFGLEELPARPFERLWLRGGFPDSFKAKTNEASYRWREDFVRTFLERDLPQLGILVPAPTLGRFWSMLAHCHGQILNWSELGRSMSVSDNTVRHYVDHLTQTFMVRTLPPWHENLSKRQVKAPKVLVRDSGLLHTLLDIRGLDTLHRHPKVGASWEGFAVECVLQQLRAERSECYFWATHQGAELDLLVIRDGKRHGFEFKLSSAPTLTKSTQIARQDLRLNSLDIVHAGKSTFQLTKGVRALAMATLIDHLEPLS